MPSCALCKSDKKNDIKYGEFLQKDHTAVHTFCLYLSSNLAQRGSDEDGFLGFLLPDIRQEQRRISQLNCCYCCKPFANIGCCAKKCRRAFHLICGLENGVENQFADTYKSYCNQHIRKISSRPSNDDTCCICYESIWDKVDNDNVESGCGDGNGAAKSKRKFNSIDMLQAPCCHNGWFHKYCLQRFAKNAGYFFKCPLCNDNKEFCHRLPYNGIFIPNSDAAWELEPHAFEELLERPNRCSARPCQNRRGPDQFTNSNPFITCTTCGSVAIHKSCMTVRSHTFQCEDCTSLLKSDSGHESLPLQNNDESVDDDDHYKDLEIDICNTDTETSDVDYEHSDKKIINMDTEFHNKGESEDKRTDGNRKHRLISSSDDDSRNNIGSWNLSQRSSEFNGKEDSDIDNDPLENFNLHIQKKKDKINQSDSKNSKDISCIGRRTRQRSSRCTEDEYEEDNKKIRENPTTLRTNIHYIENQSSKDEFDDDEIKIPHTKKLRSRRISDEDSTSTSNGSTQVFEIDYSDDDPLENFKAFLQRKTDDTANLQQDGTKNLDISCIANRTRRRSSHIGTKRSAEDKVTINRKRRATANTMCYSSNSTDSSWNIEYGCGVSKLIRPQNKTNGDDIPENEKRDTYCYPTDGASTSSWNSDAVENNILEISCIANRTRRKSSHSSFNKSHDVMTENLKRSCCTDDSSNSCASDSTCIITKFSSSESPEDGNFYDMCGGVAKNILEESCIAKRTRYKSSNLNSHKDNIYTSPTTKTSTGSNLTKRRRRQSSYCHTKKDEIGEDTAAYQSTSSREGLGGENNNLPTASLLHNIMVGHRHHQMLQRITESSSSSSKFALSSKSLPGLRRHIDTPNIKCTEQGIKRRISKIIDTDDDNNNNYSNQIPYQGQKKSYHHKNGIEPQGEDFAEAPPNNFSKSYNFLVRRRESQRDL